jgi:hypothetical protein
MNVTITQWHHHVDQQNKFPAAANKKLIITK